MDSIAILFGSEVLQRAARPPTGPLILGHTHYSSSNACAKLTGLSGAASRTKTSLGGRISVLGEASEQDEA